VVVAARLERRPVGLAALVVVVTTKALEVREILHQLPHLRAKMAVLVLAPRLITVLEAVAVQVLLVLMVPALWLVMAALVHQQTLPEPQPPMLAVVLAAITLVLLRLVQVERVVEVIAVRLDRPIPEAVVVVQFHPLQALGLNMAVTVAPALWLLRCPTLILRCSRLA
jgi:hypothetical protein